MIAEQDQLSPEPSDVASAALRQTFSRRFWDERPGQACHLRFRLFRVQRRADVETLDDLATLVRKEVHDYVQRAAQ